MVAVGSFHHGDYQKLQFFYKYSNPEKMPQAHFALCAERSDIMHFYKHYASWAYERLVKQRRKGYSVSTPWKQTKEMHELTTTGTVL